MLKTRQMIVQQTSNETTVLTICNYRHFQDKQEGDDTTESTTNSTASDTTNGQQTVHKQECIELKNGKNADIPAPDKPDADCVMPDQVMALYNEILGDLLPSCRAMSKNRKSSLRARIKEDRKRRDPDWWRRYFEHIAESSWLTGQTPGANGQVFGGADMGWILNGENMLKIIEGKYHREG